MMTVLGCIVYDHNIWLVLMAVLLCGTGSWVTSRLFSKTITASGKQRVGWQAMTALSAGVAIWCTHFVAMLGYDARVPIGFDLPLTVVSLLAVVFGNAIGFAVAISKRHFLMPALGGAIVGLAISTMHYTGMIAYRVQGIVSWDATYLVASILLSVALSSAALHFGMRKGSNLMAVVLTLAIAVLHFTGMTAFRVEPMFVDGSFSNPDSLWTLAIAISGMAFVIVACGLVSYLIDNGTRAETIEHLRQMALYDALTGLPNRANFNEKLDRELAVADTQKIRIAMIGIDLNRFKEINDTRGHHVGDEVLTDLGIRLKNLVREDKGEFIARVGGDEFAALFRIEDKDLTGVNRFLKGLEAVMFSPINVDESQIVAGASFGVAIYPNDATTKETLVSNADLAMYRAKSQLTEKRVCFYEAGMDTAVKARRCMAADLRKALSRNQLSIHYQVQTSVSTGEVTGYEALLRWHHPEHGFIPPSDFIPLAEENGLILQLGEWVLRTACTAAASWEPACKVAVNLSAVQFAAGDLPKLVMSVLLETGLAPHRLELELTETAILKDRERAFHMLRQIKSYGVSVALDDFGIGYSSIDTLRSFPFSKIKLDRSFIDEAHSNEEALTIIRTVLALGKGLRIPVLAEGVETKEQLSLLESEGCGEAQGYLLGRPASLDQILATGRLSIVERSLSSSIADAKDQTSVADVAVGRTGTDG
ncbi:bifunctional diguanylate cyclase/phosphodiesterase [uncultured Agrobacterium sp.]|uniref:putative bifunctional diguanylate cyclase/phosphodiesterase n=1 Tax=uncultured Agrobacterium sp. TaxID=157277 RepID=UPI0025F5168E|nr:bifunctional diguanylate cyclase/phosphodiesterase [uncultured Agrobacterium sp.]